MGVRKAMLTAVAVIAALVCSAAVAGSLGMKVVNIDWLNNIRDAVRITQVSVAGKNVPLGEFALHLEGRDGTPFEADDDWLKNMTITLKNRTDKVIVCAEITLWFPETKGANPDHPNATAAYMIKVGQRPASALYHRDGSKIPPDTANKPVVFAPGQTLVIPIADYVDEIQSQVEGVGNTAFSHITKLNIQRNLFYFIDGTTWAVDSYFAPDPEHPGNYTRLPDNYFPGHLVSSGKTGE